MPIGVEARRHAVPAEVERGVAVSPDCLPGWVLAPLGRRYPRFLEMLDAEDRRFLVSRSTERKLAKGEFLYQQGDESHHLFILQSGAVKVHYMRDGGGSLTVSYYREGMLVGAHGCTQWAGNHIWSAQALIDSTALKMRRSDLIALVDNSPAAMRCILAITEFKGEQLRKLIRILSMPVLEVRVAATLYHLASLYGIGRGGELEIDGRFTHQEIAEMVGASRQSVTTVLLLLERARQIRRVGRTLYIRMPVPSQRAAFN